MQREADKEHRRMTDWAEASAKLDSKVDDLGVKVNYLLLGKLSEVGKPKRGHGAGV